MIIGIDIRVLGNRTKSGVEEYTENLLSHLLSLDRNIKFKLFFSSSRLSLGDYPWLHLPNVELHNFKISNKLLFTSTHFLNRPYLDRLIGGADVFFSPHFLLTSLSAGCKRVTTFHDLSFISFPEFFSWRRNFWHQMEMRPRWQSQFSDRIIAVSESTKNDLVKIYNVDPVKIDVVYSGLSTEIKRPGDDLLSQFRSEHNIPENFILSLGKLEPRKNVGSLIEAFNILKRKSGFSNLHLVIVGSRGWLYEDIFKKINSSPFRNQIILKDHIKDEERRFYYSLASVFVYPSFFEGFGFPPLEAMACGTATITAHSSSLPEVMGGASIMINPNNINELASSIYAILLDNNLKTKILNKGLKQASRFNWSKTAEETLVCLTK